MARRANRQRGFSLVELSVGLAVAGLAGMAAWTLLPAMRQVADGDPVQRLLTTTQQAVEGHITLNHRLPCPAADTNGVESCGAGALGFVPWRTLGLDRRHAVLRYGAYRGVADLAAPGNAFQPPLPPLPVVSVASYNPATVNGLDFCAAVRNATAVPAGLTAGGVPAAYAVVHPGVNLRFDGLNAGAIDLPGRAHSDTYDDRVAASGLAELSGRLACPTRLASALDAARSAYAAYDIDRDMQMFLRFRDFAYQIRQTNTRYAEMNVALTATDLAIAAGAAASSLSIAANSVGIGAGVVVAAVLGVGAAIAAQIAADIELVNAIASEETARKQALGALQVRVRSTAELQVAVERTWQRDLQGVLP